MKVFIVLGLFLTVALATDMVREEAFFHENTRTSQGYDSWKLDGNRVVTFGLSW